MTTVNTVLGPVDSSKLGFTLMHEHLMTAAAGMTQNYAEIMGSGFLDKIVKSLKEAKQGGVDTIVDATTLDLGRDVNVLAEASRRSGVNIITVAGWWLETPRFLGGISADQYAKMFVREIEEGIAGTKIKAGLLKSASDAPGVTPENEVILRAIARAHHKTGTPIMLHSYPTGQVGRRQLEVLKSEGVDLSRVKVDHSNDTTDVEYLTWLLGQGCYLGMDRYPGRIVSPLARSKTMKALIDAGYVDRLLPSHDHCPAPPVAEDLPPMPNNNPHGYLYVKKIVFQHLRELGVPGAIVDRLCFVGPRNFFEGVK